MSRPGLRSLTAMAVVTAGIAASGASAAATGAATVPSLAAARLQGFYAMSGKVLDAVNVGGQSSGEQVRRLWAFGSFCPSGACATVALTRRRAFGVNDKLVLHRRAPAFYAGTGTFDGPVLCQGRRIARGTRVPFRITVRVTAAKTVAPGQVLATRIRAFYHDQSRAGLTHCVNAPAHETVRYTGQPYAPPSVGSTRSDVSSRSTPSS